MKSTNKTLSKAIKAIATNSLKRDANSTTCIAVYQPKVPSALKEFSKINK